MPATNPQSSPSSRPTLQALGHHIRARRKSLGVSATATAEAAGISRVTLHRIEKGEPSVTIGAWANTLAALGLEWQTRLPGDTPQTPDPATHNPAHWLPVCVQLSDYPQLKALAWQVHGTPTLTLVEALDIYERNARHLDMQAMSEKERALLNALRTAFGRNSHV
ncbi:MAG: helix-turn-helix domain-containing protein [Hydrogenophaga sp.]|nr:helix-turn-helix domain-containing protein [Hydrogenophaga sp.]MDP1894250.1 helix-turn-helix domain-containing protein [Hydrogenophaga sp.]MDP2094697.1 helix-turn-helix domain-containing protein [Hydrogenophaga sp.]MDP2221485.1 helix-turn-helix domain-containing protein [Hydrogenophaga sp.]